MEEMLKDTDIAKMLNASLDTVRKWRTTNKGPVWVKIGGIVRYPRKDFEEYVAANRSDKQVG